VEVVPFAFQQKKSTRLVYKKIVIPGTINSQTRNYAMLLEMLPDLMKKWKKPLELVFLGALNQGFLEKKAIEELTQEFPDFTVRFFAAKVDEKEYINQLEKATAIFLPLRQEICVGVFWEQTGYSRISGGIFDAMTFDLPLIVPSFHPFLANQKVYKYQNTIDCTAVLFQLLNDNLPKTEEKIFTQNQLTTTFNILINTSTN
jgi:hypothetical protein